jgi:hypothetical protein
MNKDLRFTVQSQSPDKRFPRLASRETGLKEVFIQAYFRGEKGNHPG